MSGTEWHYRIEYCHLRLQAASLRACTGLAACLRQLLANCEGYFYRYGATGAKRTLGCSVDRSLSTARHQGRSAVSGAVSALSVGGMASLLQHYAQPPGCRRFNAGCISQGVSQPESVRRPLFLQNVAVPGGHQHLPKRNSAAWKTAAGSRNGNGHNRRNYAFGPIGRKGIPEPQPARTAGRSAGQPGHGCQRNFVYEGYGRTAV